MQQIATITSKRQLTIPISIYRSLGLQKGQKVIIKEEKKAIKIEPAVNLVEKLAGSVKIPSRFKSLSLEKIINKAKKEYFKKQ